MQEELKKSYNDHTIYLSYRERMYSREQMQEIADRMYSNLKNVISGLELNRVSNEIPATHM